MKKTVTLLMLVALFVCAITPVMASQTSFSFSAQSRYGDDDNLQTDGDVFVYKSKYDDDTLYVNHHVVFGNNTYTNRFRAYFTSDFGNFMGSAWPRPNKTDPLISSSIVINDSYGLAGRGNTKHYESDGRSTVLLEGTFYGDRPLN